MIRALAHGGNVLKEPKYTDAASKAARFLLDHHRAAGGSLFRTSRDGVKKYPGFLDDYAFLGQALLALGWRDQAEEITRLMGEKFGDEAGGFYFTAADATDLVVRQKTASDSPLPSGNAVAIMNLIDLGDRETARRALAGFAQQIQQQAEGMSAMVQAARMYVERFGPLEVEASMDSSAERPLSPRELAERVVAISGSWASPDRAEIRLQILKPFHINASTPGEGLIGTVLSISGATVESVEYPQGNVWEGQVKIVVRFKKAVKETLHASLRYQACDESACLAEVTKSFEISPSAGNPR
jgi:hypothetical protein